MNLPTILISLVIASLLVLAVRFIVRHGVCEACDMQDACRTSKNAGGGFSCGPGGCPSCRYYEYERKAAAKRRPDA